MRGLSSEVELGSSNFRNSSQRPEKACKSICNVLLIGSDDHIQILPPIRKLVMAGVKNTRQILNMGSYEFIPQKLRESAESDRGSSSFETELFSLTEFSVGPSATLTAKSKKD